MPKNVNRKYDIAELLDPLAAQPPASDAVAVQQANAAAAAAMYQATRIKAANPPVALNPLQAAEPTAAATPGINYMDVAEFQISGLLQEVNRLFLHPMGVALSIMINDETGEKTMGPIWDYRDDPEGLLFDPETIASATFRQKADNVQRMVIATRKDKLGFVVQPIPETPPPETS